MDHSVSTRLAGSPSADQTPNHEPTEKIVTPTKMLTRMAVKTLALLALLAERDCPGTTNADVVVVCAPLIAVSAEPGTAKVPVLVLETAMVGYDKGLAGSLTKGSPVLLVLGTAVVGYGKPGGSLMLIVKGSPIGLSDGKGIRPLSSRMLVGSSVASRSTMRAWSPDAVGNTLVAA